jgi:L-ascorbate metabolism protein UlaG (beta-lactamase superfamily)
MRKTILPVLVVIAILVIPVFSTCTESKSEPSKSEPSKSEPVKSETGVSKSDGVMIWYLCHCGYAVKTEKHLLIFDYTERGEEPSKRGLDTGWIDPLELKDLDVCIFTTHDHIDHYNSATLDWEKDIRKIRYFFGWQMEEKSNYYSMPAPRAQLKLDDMEIYTVNSHHSDVPEVAYLIKIDGLVIYHGGDYQGRMEPDGESKVVGDMAYLKPKAASPDLFFIGAWTGDPYIKSIEALEPKVIFSMHYGGKEEKYKQFASDLKDLGFKQPVMCPDKSGDKFVYKDGKIEKV